MHVSDTTPISPQQRKAAADLLRKTAAPAAELGRIFAGRGHELALVGGPVRDVFLVRPHSDLDLATDAAPPQVLGETARGAPIGRRMPVTMRRGGVGGDG